MTSSDLMEKVQPRCPKPKARIQALEYQLSELQQERRRYLADRAVVAILSDGDNKKFTRERFASITGVDFHGNRFVLCGFTDTFSEPGSMDALSVWEALGSTFYCRMADLICPQFKRQHACVTANFNGCIYCLVNLSDQLPSTDYRKAFTGMCGNLTIREIAEQVGYGAQINMIRAFKRLEGKTPSEFLRERR